VIVSGSYASVLGVYVFDAQGNCVARDDMSEPQTADDLITEWIPIEQAHTRVPSQQEWHDTPALVLPHRNRNY